MQVKFMYVYGISHDGSGKIPPIKALRAELPPNANGLKEAKQIVDEVVARDCFAPDVVVKLRDDANLDALQVHFDFELVRDKNSLIPVERLHDFLEELDPNMTVREVVASLRLAEDLSKVITFS